MKKCSYSQEIAQAIDGHLSKEGWKYRFHEDTGIFEFLVSIPGRAKVLNYLVYVSDYGFTVYARYPLGPNPDNEKELGTVARFLTRANYGLRSGNFEMDLNDGEIRYKVHSSCCDIEPSEKLVFECIHCCSAMCQKYGPGLQDILFRGVSDREAIMKCENDVSHLLAKLKRAKASAEEMRGGVQNADEKTGADPTASAPVEEDPAHLSFAPILRALAEKALANRKDTEEQETDEDALDEEQDDLEKKQ